MTPYYEQSGQTIYLGDCRDVIEQWEGQHGVKSFDLLLTDPPYGIGPLWKGGFGSGWGKSQQEAEARNS